MNKFMGLALALAPIMAGCSSETETTPQTNVETPKSVSPVAVIEGKASGPVYTDDKGDVLALSGYDAISYFTGDAGPVEGSADHIVLYQGFEYRFATDDNAEIFAADPARYIPAFGGHCAWTMAHSQLAPGDPKIFRIRDGRLYLLYDELVEAEFVKNPGRFIQEAEAAYPVFTTDQRYDDLKPLQNM